MHYESLNRYLLQSIFIIIFSAGTILNASSIPIIYASSMPDITKEKDGTFSQLSTLLTDYRNKHKEVLFIFGGASLGPSIVSYMDKGSHIIDILNILEPDVFSVNKREFIFSHDELSLKTYDALFPFVSSNVVYENNKKEIEGVSKSLIIEKSNIKFGIVSVLKEDAKQEYAIKEITINDVETSIRETSKILKKQGADIIILLTSNPLSLVDDLLKEGVINIAFSKNEYNKKTKIKNKNNIYIKESQNIAISTLAKKNNKYTFNTKQISLSKFSKEENLNKIILNYQTKLDAFLDENIGTITTFVSTMRNEVRTKENLFANLLTDSMKDYTNSDIAFINGGTIRGDKVYKKNTVFKRRTIVDELPFRNKVVLLKIKGSVIIDALENGLSLIEKEKGRFPHFSGMKVIYDSSENIGNRVKEIFINGNKLIKSKTYKLATTDYLYSGGDGYFMFEKATLIKYHKSMHRLISNILIDYILYKKILNPKFEERIIDLSDKK